MGVGRRGGCGEGEVVVERGGKEGEREGETGRRRGGERGWRKVNTPDPPRPT